MRWFFGVVVFDILLVAWVVLSATQSERADFVFANNSLHNTLDPQRLSWSHDIRVMENLFEPLTRIKLPEMTPEPAAAERWEVSEDGLTYTFYIRPEAKWSNGDPVRSTDFKYSWRRALLPDLAADYTQLLWVIKGAEDFFNWRQADLKEYAEGSIKTEELARLPFLSVPDLMMFVRSKIRTQEYAEARVEATYAKFDELVHIRTPDERTLIVTLENPTAYFLEMCAFITYVPVHADSVDAQTSVNVDSGMIMQDPYWIRPIDDATDTKPALVTNGPYQLQRRRFKRDLLLVSNDNFWARKLPDGDPRKPRNNSILEIIVPDANAQRMMFERGEVDWIPNMPTTGGMAADLVELKRKGARDDVHTVPSAGTYYYMFNTQDKLVDGSANPVADPRVRRALSLAIDRQKIVDDITRLEQPVAATFVPKGSLVGYDAPVEAGPTYNIEKAKELLAEAGYPNGEGLSGVSILYNTGSAHEIIAQQIAYNWEAQLNIGVSLYGQEVKVFGERLKKQDFVVARSGWFGDYLDPTTFLDKFKSANGNNDGRYNSKKYDRLMDEAAKELDPKKRMTLLRDAEATMLSDAAIAPIYQYVTIHLFDPKRVKNMHLNPWNFRRLELVEVLRD